MSDEGTVLRFPNRLSKSSNAVAEKSESSTVVGTEMVFGCSTVDGNVYWLAIDNERRLQNAIERGILRDAKDASGEDYKLNCKHIVAYWKEEE